MSELVYKLYICTEDFAREVDVPEPLSPQEVLVAALDEAQASAARDAYVAGELRMVAMEWGGQIVPVLLGVKL